VQQSVWNALKLDVLYVTTQALGIIGKVATGHRMRLVGRSDLTILDMNPYYAGARGKLQLWSEDASPLLGPSPPSFFTDVPIKADFVLDSLMQTTSSNEETVTLLQDLCRGCLAIVKRQSRHSLRGSSVIPVKSYTIRLNPALQLTSVVREMFRLLKSLSEQILQEKG